MRFMFVYWAHENHGSAQDIHTYARVAAAMGHEVALFGPPRDGSIFNWSLDIESADAVVFVFEFTTHIAYGEKMALLRMFGRVPRERRIIIDCDGKYNEAIRIDGDVNHESEQLSRNWRDICDCLSDKIFQPTHHPRQPHVRPFFFHAYNPDWERPIEWRGKDFGMIYVGNNWFRWRPMQRVLEAIVPIRDRVGRVGIVGDGWTSAEPWGGEMESADAYHTDPRYLEELSVEVMGPVRVDRVIDAMGWGLFSPVILRPLFDELNLVTCRTYETVAANTIPLFSQEEAYVAEIYGDDAVELVLPRRNPESKVANLLARPDHFAGLVRNMRRHLRGIYSYEARLNELEEIVAA